MEAEAKKRLTLRDILSNTLSLMAQIIVQGRTLNTEDNEESYESDWLNFKTKCWKSVDKKITKLWSTTNSPTSLSVDVYSEYRDAEQKDPTLHHLEQWNISYDTTPNDAAKDKTINSKKTIILLRTLYTMIRQLPIYKLMRNMKSQQSNSNLKQNNNHFNIKWSLIQRPGTFPNSFEIQKKPNEKKSPRIDVFDFGHISTKFGSLSCHVKYIADFSSHLSLPRTIIPYIIADYSPPSSSPIQILTPSTTAPNNLLPSRSSSNSSSSSSSSTSTSVPRPIASKPLNPRPSSSLESSFHQIQSPPFSNFPPTALSPSPNSPTSEHLTGSAPNSFSSSLPKSPSSAPIHPSSSVSSSSYIHLHQDPLISLAAVDTWSSSPPPHTSSSSHLNSIVPSSSTSPGSPPAFLMELESSTGPFALNVPLSDGAFSNTMRTSASGSGNHSNSMFAMEGNSSLGVSGATATASVIANAVMNPLGSTELISFLIMCNQPRKLSMFSRKKSSKDPVDSPTPKTPSPTTPGIAEEGLEKEKRNLMSYSAEIVQLTNFAKLAGTSPKNNGIISQMAAHLLANGTVSTMSNPSSSPIITGSPTVNSPHNTHNNNNNQGAVGDRSGREEVALMRVRSQPEGRREEGGLSAVMREEEGSGEGEGRRVGMQRKRSSSLLTRIMLEKPKAKSGS